MKNIFLILILLPICVLAQNKPYYSAVKTNLSDYTISAICQDKHGRLIIGTDKGLFTFNGFQTKQISTQTLYSKEIVSLIHVGRNVIGLTKTGQLFAFDDNAVKPFLAPDVKGPIKKIQSNVNGELLILGYNTVYYYKLNPISLIKMIEIPFADKEMAELVDYIETDKGKYALLSSNELVEVNEETAVSIPGNKTRWIYENEGSINTVPLDPSSFARYQYRGKRFVIQSRVRGGINHEITKFEPLDNQYAMLSKTGLMLLDKTTFTVSSAIVGFHVTSILKDRSNTIWFGTKGRGLFCIPTGAFQIINPNDFQTVNSIPNSENLVVENVAGIKTIITSSGKSVHNAGNSRVDLSVYNLHFSFPYIIQDEVIKQLFHLSENSFALASSKGVYRFSAKNAKEFKKYLENIHLREQVVDYPVKEWALSDEKELMFSSLDGLHVVDLLSGKHDKITFFNESIDGSQIIVDNEKWYVLTPDSHLYVIRGKKVVQDINFRNDKNSIPVRKIKKKGNYFYLLSENALYRTRNFRGDFERLGELSKLSDLALRDFDIVKNNVFIATQFGIVRVFWKNEETIFPELLIGKAYGDFQKNKSVEFSFKNTHISIPFELVDLTISHPFIVEYRLVQNNNDHDEKWHSALASGNGLSFEHLRSGDYRLEIRLSDPGTKSVSKTLTTHFFIESAWYESAVLWLLTGVLVGGFGVVYLLREKRKFKKAQIRKRIVKRKQ